MATNSSACRSPLAGALLLLSQNSQFRELTDEILASHSSQRNRCRRHCHRGPPVIFVGSIALSAAGSFRRERELGAVTELLLVAPLRVGQIVAGRVRSLWGQFLPAVTLFLAVWWFFSPVSGPLSGVGDRKLQRLDLHLAVGDLVRHAPGDWIVFLVCVASRHYLVAALLTVTIGLALPYAFSVLCQAALALGRGWLPRGVGPGLMRLFAALALRRIGRWTDYSLLAWCAVGFILLPFVWSLPQAAWWDFPGTSSGSWVRKLDQLFSSRSRP